MGYWEERGRPALSGAVCLNCIAEPALKASFRKRLCEETCDFCGRKAGHPIAVDFDDLFQDIFDAIASEYTDPTNALGWDSEDGAYVGETLDGSDILGEIGLNFRNNKLLDAIIDALGDRSWCERDYYAGPQNERMMVSWETFNDFVMHKVRYFFQTAPAPSTLGPADISPAAILGEIGRVVKETGLVRVITPRRALYRARPHGTHERPATASELGSPPVGSAIYANRMSPAGIPMFYGAFDSDTAVLETVSGRLDRAGAVTIGRFHATRPLAVIDLSAIPEIPSIFDRKHRAARPAIMFLRDFAKDFSRPIAKNGREHIEYVPTQIVTEYFRHAFLKRHRPIDGILYRSARHRGGTCCVLFCDNAQCCDRAPSRGKDDKNVLWLAKARRLSTTYVNGLISRCTPSRSR